MNNPYCQCVCSCVCVCEIFPYFLFYMDEYIYVAPVCEKLQLTIRIIMLFRFRIGIHNKIDL